MTLDGQVVNAGGSMTGGSQARSAGLLSRSADIAQGKEKNCRFGTAGRKSQRDISGNRTAYNQSRTGD